MTRTKLGVTLLFLAHAVVLGCNAPDSIAQRGRVVDTTRGASTSAAPKSVSTSRPTGALSIVDTGAVPNGWLLFALMSDGRHFHHSRIYAIRTDGTGLTAVTPRGQFVEGPAWSPDGSLIAYMSDDSTTGGWAISVARADGSGSRKLDGGDYPFWLADGRIGYSCYGGLCAIDPSGANRVLLYKEKEGLDMQYGLSPDGSLVSFLRFVEGPDEVLPREAIFIVRRDGTGERRLTSTDAAIVDETSPSWSPDGSRLTFRSKTLGIAVVDADGGRLHSVSGGKDLPGVHDSGPAWSPDGTRILVGGKGGTFYIANADGSGVIRRVRAHVLAGGEPWAAWSWTLR